MSPLVQQPAPHFKATAVMPDGTFHELSLADFHERYLILFFYPMDFTFVCPTEIVAFSEAAERFAQLNVDLLGVSIDSHFTHLAWRNTPREEGGIGSIAYPLISDLDKSIAKSYGVLLPEGVALRALFLIDREGVVRHQLVNDLSLGRNVDEALRLVQALQHTEQHGDVCPANWSAGVPTIKPDVVESKEYFRKVHADLPL